MVSNVLLDGPMVQTIFVLGIMLNTPLFYEMISDHDTAQIPKGIKAGNDVLMNNYHLVCVNRLTVKNDDLQFLCKSP